MKKLNLIGCLLLLLVSACGGEDHNITTLTGSIEGLGNDTLYLYGVDKYYDRVDTIAVRNDKFNISLQADTLVETRLLFNNGLSYPIFLDKGNHIEIEGKEAELPVLKVKGNLANKEMSAFQQDLKNLEEPSEKMLAEKAETFIQNHPFSLVSLYLLDHYFVQKPQPDFEHIQKLIDGLSGDLKDRPYVTELINSLKAIRKGKAGNNLPYFRLPDAKGEKKSRSNFKDKYLLIHFWASWDTLSCQKNALYRKIYQQEKKNKRFAILGISLDMDKTAWEHCIKRDTLQWEQLCDFNCWETGLMKQLNITSIPYNLFISPSGNIEACQLDEKTIQDKLNQINTSKKNAR